MQQFLWETIEEQQRSGDRPCEHPAGDAELPQTAQPQASPPQPLTEELCKRWRDQECSESAMYPSGGETPSTTPSDPAFILPDPTCTDPRALPGISCGLIGVLGWLVPKWLAESPAGHVQLLLTGGFSIPDHSGSAQVDSWPCAEQEGWKKKRRLSQGLQLLGLQSDDYALRLVSGIDYRYAVLMSVQSQRQPDE
ncbi:MAG: hypothetical protein FRX49_04201 [Trebouxia sp. A1-2]|nr:MAG: hypothetical protein FRX49_04201 [Trebouxia sp. A1-2]